MFNLPLHTGVLSILLFHIASAAVLEQYFNVASTCEIDCEKEFAETSDQRKSCAEGCRLYTVIDLAKGFSDYNKTIGLCLSACSEAFINDTLAEACSFGCKHNVIITKEKDDVQTLHLLTPLIYVKSAYNTMAHHMKQFISTSWTVYVQEDSGKMVILQTNPKVVESSDMSVSRPRSNDLKKYQQNWQDEKLDWMDCISHQAGIPRWLLVIVIFGFVIALLWLCCATAVTAPNQYLPSAKKKNVGYLLLCEPNHEIKPSPHILNQEEEAPPLPPKVTLI